MSGAGELSAEGWWRPVVARPEETASGAPAESQRSPLAFWCLMYFLFSLLIAPQTFVPGLDALHLAMVTAVVAIAAHVTSALRSGRSLFARHPAVPWAGVLAAWALLTAPFSRWPGGTVELLTDLYFKSVLIFWLLGAVVDTHVRLKQMVTLLSLLTVPIAIVALQHFVRGVYIPGGDSSAPRILGYDAPLTANPNDLALVMSMMLPLSGSLAFAERRPLRRLLFAGIALLDVAATVITFSRTGFVTLGALGVALLLQLPARRALPWCFALAGVALVLFPLLPGYMEHMETITAIQTDPTGSAQTRWADMVTAAGLVLANPLIGAGAGMSVLALNDARGASWTPVHNVYLEYATDLGLPGLLFFLLMLGACIRVVMRVVREIPRTEAAWDLRCLAIGIQLMLVAFVVAGFFHPVAYHFHFYYAGGLATALAVVWENERGSLSSDSGVRQRVGDRWHRATVREPGAWHRSGPVPGPRGRTLTLGPFTRRDR